MTFGSQERDTGTCLSCSACRGAVSLARTRLLNLVQELVSSATYARAARTEFGVMIFLPKNKGFRLGKNLKFLSLTNNSALSNFQETNCFSLDITNQN